MLTNAAVKAARPLARAYKKWDAGGLYLHVVPTGRRSWMLRVRSGGRESLMTLGQWPELSLDAARARRDAARAAILAGHDPRGDQNAVNCFEDAARAWHAHRAPGWSRVHAGDVLGSLERDVFPAIGALPLEQVTKPAVLRLLRTIEARGAIETARRVRQRVEMVHAFAQDEGWTTAENPAGSGEALANAPARGRHPALVDMGELRELMAAVDGLSATPVTKAAHLFLALTVMRLSALRLMTWTEVEDLDGPAPLWRVPAAHLKLKAVNKADPDRHHLVPLAPAAAAVLRALREAGGGTGRVFAGRAGEAPIGEGAIGELYTRAGYAGRHVPHGWRASWSTVMNERRKEDRFAIDRALGHVVTGVSAKEGAYNRAQHLALRRELLEEWAGLLTRDDRNEAAPLTTF